jgi:putative transcriptional regulator
MLDLRQQAKTFLEGSDYATFEYHGCFDIAAKKDVLLFIKVLLNIDSFQKEQAKNLKVISNNLDGYPLLIGVQTNREKLRKGIVYERFEMPTLSLETFEELICQQIFPRIYRDKGGLYVEVDSQVMKDARTSKNLTQRELAEAVGINKKVIYEHEKKQLRMLLSIAEKLEGILNERIIKSSDVFKKYEAHGIPNDAMEKNIGMNLERLGFKIDFVKQSPLDVFAKEDSMIISDIEVDKRKMKRRAAELKDFISIVKKPALVITEGMKEDEILGIPLIERKELKDMEGKDLIKRARKAI